MSRKKINSIQEVKKTKAIEEKEGKYSGYWQR